MLIKAIATTPREKAGPNYKNTTILDYNNKTKHSGGTKEEKLAQEGEEEEEETLKC